ncbi:MAG: hypothetical protein KAT62_02590 [Desulfuromonadales bacterium]|nr:hypothetical protein [Desulfuromonadales bacterium]
MINPGRRGRDVVDKSTNFTVILSPCCTKAIICYLATRRCRIAEVDVAKRLSYSSSAVSQSAKGGRQIFEDDETLRDLLD